MDAETRVHFAEIIARAEAVFEQVEYDFDVTPERAILRLQASYSRYRIFVTELLGDDTRKYRYYILDGDQVEAGFDNSPDPRAIRLKYGRIGMEHVGELVPHLHLEDKTRLFLTEETSFDAFIDWLQAKIPREK